MEEEVKTNFFTKILNWIKSHTIIVGVVVVALIVIALLFSIFVGGPKKAVKKYVSAMNSKNVSKVINSMDLQGTLAWLYSYDTDDFDEDDYEDFVDDYNDVDRDDVKDRKDLIKDGLEEQFEEQKDDYKKYKIKVEKIKDVKKLGKNLYAVEAKISLYAVPKDKDDKELDESTTTTFVVYNNKVISMNIFN